MKYHLQITLCCNYCAEIFHPRSKLRTFHLKAYDGDKKYFGLMM